MRGLTCLLVLLCLGFASSFDDERVSASLTSAGQCFPSSSPVASLYLPRMYRAAAIQFDAGIDSRHESASEIISTNLDKIELLIREAADQDADIVVLPEASVGWNSANWIRSRSDLALFCEPIDSAYTTLSRTSTGGFKLDHCNTSSSSSSSSQQVARFSNIAAELSLVLATSMCVRVECSPTDSEVHYCPTDGYFLYNSQVVFDEKGDIIAVNHKRHLFASEELFFDSDEKGDLSEFVTSFGVRFGLLICFDMEFASSTKPLRQRGVRDFVMSMSWRNAFPVQFSTEMQQAWSREFAANMIVANSGDAMSNGGGIFSNGKVLVDALAPHASLPDQVLVSTLTFDPATESDRRGTLPGPEPASSRAKRITRVQTCSMSPNLPGMTSVCADVPLGNASFVLEQNGLQCRFTTERSNAVERFMALVFSGRLEYGQSSFGLQVCALSRYEQDPALHDLSKSRTSLVSFSIDALSTMHVAAADNSVLFPFAAFSEGRLVPEEHIGFDGDLQARIWSIGALSSPILNVALWNMLQDPALEKDNNHVILRGIKTN